MGEAVTVSLASCRTFIDGFAGTRLVTLLASTGESFVIDVSPTGVWGFSPQAAVDFASVLDTVLSSGGVMLLRQFLVHPPAHAPIHDGKEPCHDLRPRMFAVVFDAGIGFGLLAPEVARLYPSEDLDLMLFPPFPQGMESLGFCPL